MPAHTSRSARTRVVALAAIAAALLLPCLAAAQTRAPGDASIGHASRPRDLRWIVAGGSIFESLQTANVAFGASWIASGQPTTGAWMMLPIAGPLIAAATDRESGGLVDLTGYKRAAMVVDGLVQAVGLGMVMAGAVTVVDTHAPREARSRSMQWVAVGTALAP